MYVQLISSFKPFTEDNFVVYLKIEKSEQICTI